MKVAGLIISLGFIYALNEGLQRNDQYYYCQLAETINYQSWLEFNQGHYEIDCYEACIIETQDNVYCDELFKGVEND